MQSPIVTERVEDWPDEKNLEIKDRNLQSYPRDLFCSLCNSQVVLTNILWERVNSGDIEPCIACRRCFLQGKGKLTRV